MKHNLLSLGLCAILLSGCERASVKPAYKHFNILTGMKPAEILHIHNHYDLLVVNADHLNKKDIQSLHSHAKKVYGYLDIAAIAPKSKSFHQYENKIVEPTISKRKYYINTHSKSWQTHILKQAQSLKAKGIDGYMLDHCDFYHKNGNAKIYQGLKKIVTGIHQENKPILLKNAMNFIEKDDTIMKEIQGVVQEDVFTYWNHHKDEREDVPKTQSNNLKIYLNNMKSLHKAVYVIDFTKKSDWQAVISAEGKKYGWSILQAKKTDYSIE